MRAVLLALFALGLAIRTGAAQTPAAPPDQTTPPAAPAAPAAPEAPLAPEAPAAPDAQAAPAVRTPAEARGRRRAARREAPARVVMVPDTVLITPPGQVCQVARDARGRPAGCLLVDVPGQVAVRERAVRIHAPQLPRRGAPLRATAVEPTLSTGSLAWSLAPAPGPIVYRGPFIDPWPNLGFAPTIRYKPVAGGYGLFVSPGPPPTELPGLLRYP